MEWKFVDGYNNRYKINKNGDVCEDDVKVESFIHKTLEIPFVTFIRPGGHSNSHSVARLVWEAFNGEIGRDKKIKYRDNDPNNISLDNLILSKIKRKKNRKIIVIDDTDENESIEWKHVANCNKKYKVYKNGDVYQDNNKINPYFNHRYNGLFVKLINERNREINYMVARLVYETFIGTIRDDFYISYKDGDSNNFHLDNLEILKRYKKINGDLPIELDKSKQWKPLRGCEELYKISENGDVYSIITNKMMTQSMKSKGYDNNYYHVTLTKNGKSCTKPVHTLVYGTFKDVDLDKKKVIDHIDRNKINNHISNLREVTRSENNKNRDQKERSPYSKISQYDLDGNFIKEWNSFNDIVKSNPTYKRSIKLCCLGKRKHAYGFVWKYSDFVIDQTEYVQIKTDDGKLYSNYKINRDGIIINQDGYKMKHTINEYLKINLTSDCGKRKTFSVHRLVALTFISNPENKPIVNHLDENKHNYHVDNLEWATNSRNIRYSRSKQVQQIDIDTEVVIKTFECITDALIGIGKSNWDGGGIGRVCKGKQQTAYGYKWKIVE